MKKLKIYLPFVSAGMQEVATYRVNWIFYMLGNVMTCGVSYFIWKAVYASGGSGAISGFTMPQMVVYIVMMFLTNTIIASDVSYVIGEEVRDGAIAMRLLKPVSYNATFLFQEIGNKLFTEFILAVPLVPAAELIRFAFYGSVQFNPLAFVLFLLSATLAYLMNFFFNICFHVVLRILHGCMPWVICIGVNALAVVEAGHQLHIAIRIGNGHEGLVAHLQISMVITLATFVNSRPVICESIFNRHICRTT